MSHGLRLSSIITSYLVRGRVGVRVGVRVRVRGRVRGRSPCVPVHLKAVLVVDHHFLHGE